MRIFVADHQSKSRLLAAALVGRGHRVVADPREADVCLIDHDVPSHGKVQLATACVASGGRAYLYPHGGNASLMSGWDGLHVPWEHLSGALVTAPGHVEVARLVGYPHPVHPVGWTFCETRPRRLTGRLDKIVFAPTHPPWGEAADHAILERLVATGAQLTVKLIGTVEENGLTRLPGVTYVEGGFAGFDQMLEIIDGADAVVAVHGTFASMAVARGITTVTWASGHMGDKARPGEPRHAELYRDFVRYPFDLADGELEDVLAAAAADEERVAAWRDDFIGGDLDPDALLDALADDHGRHSRNASAIRVGGAALLQARERDPLDADLAEAVAAVAGTPPSAAPVVSIVIPVFNQLEMTRLCLASIAAVTDDVPYEVIVVDNASTDGTREFLREREAGGLLRALVNEENLGFGRACNAGAALARGDYVLLLNNDTVPHPGWLSALVSSIETEPAIGLAGSRLLYADGTVQHAGVTFRTPWRTDHAYRHAPGNHPDVLVSKDYPAVTGACILMPRDLWEALGGLDEGYRHYVEDVDLCMRVWAAGRRVRYCAESVVTHLEQQSAPNRAWVADLVDEGWRRFHQRWASRWPDEVKRLSHVVLPEGTRPFAVVALAREIVEAPQLLQAYAGRFDQDDDATLVIFDPELSSEEIGDVLGPVLTETGLAETGPDMLALGGPAVQLEALAGAAQGLLGRMAPAAALARLPLYQEADVDLLRLQAERFWASVG
jgi:GT2 family glycosyltransferase